MCKDKWNCINCDYNKYLITTKTLVITFHIRILWWKNEIDSICQDISMKIIIIWTFLEGEKINALIHLNDL
jgi:hypothetical protein